MINWVVHRERVQTMRPSLAIQLTDAMTKLPPDDPSLEVSLEKVDFDGSWHPVLATPIPVPGGVIAFRNLERRRRAVGATAQLYRLTVHSDRYLPDYLRTTDAVTVLIQPFDLLTVPPPSPPPYVAVTLCPRPDYPFPSVPLVLGQVLEASDQAPVTNALVFGGIGRFTVTDDRGAYALPLPGAPFATPIAIGVQDRRNRQATQNVSFTSNVSKQSLNFSLP
jgi:hypothetical protein